MSLAENKQIVQNFIEEIFNKANLEGVSRFVTPDFIYHARGEDVTGIENFKSGFRQIVAYFLISGLQW
jgi:hypothetical protein